MPDKETCGKFALALEEKNVIDFTIKLIEIFGSSVYAMPYRKEFASELIALIELIAQNNNQLNLGEYEVTRIQKLFDDVFYLITDFLRKIYPTIMHDGQSTAKIGRAHRFFKRRCKILSNNNINQEG